MTNTRILIAAVVAILGLWFFTKPAAPKRKLTATAQIQNAKPQSPKTPPSAVARLEKSVATQPVNENDEQSKCWKAIEDANPPTSGYINVARKDLEGVVGDWYFDDTVKPDFTRNPPKTSEKFLWALARAGFLHGNQNFERDEDEAYVLLLEAAEEDPQNAAPLMYLAALEERNNNPYRASMYLDEAMQRSHFNSYRKDIHRAMMKGVRSPNDLLAAQQALSTAPAPEVTVFKKVLQYQNYAGLAVNMMRDALDPENNIIGLEFDHWETIIGWHILDKMGLSAGVPKYDQLFNSKKNQLRKCHPGVLNDYVTEIQAKFSR